MSYLSKFRTGLVYVLDLPIILFLNNTRRTRVVIRYKDSILVTKSWLGDQKWGLPGGGLKKNESTKQGAVREVQEEVGILLNKDSLTDHGEHFFQDKHIKFTICLISVRLSTKPSVKKQRHEIADYDWLPQSSLDENNAGKELLMALKLLS